MFSNGCLKCVKITVIIFTQMRRYKELRDKIIALLFKRSMFIQDTRDEFENDGCRGRGLSVCCKFLKRIYHTGFSENELTLKAKYDHWSVLQGGRSMIEMLGVLAIIGVLSVGGIAGYSKAMEKWKINKAIAGYSYLTHGLLEHIDNLRNLKSDNGSNKYDLAETIKGLNLLPEGWSFENSTVISDTVGSIITIFSRDNHLVYDIALGNVSSTDNYLVSDNFSTKLCREFISNFAQPLHSSLQFVWIFRTKNGNIHYYGDSQCTDSNKCLVNMTLSDIQNVCTSCAIGEEYCLFVLEF